MISSHRNIIAKLVHDAKCIFGALVNRRSGRVKGVVQLHAVKLCVWHYQGDRGFMRIPPLRIVNMSGNARVSRRIEPELAEL